MDALVNSLTEAELGVIRETDREAMAGLDEDALLDLHQRIRRERNKYQGQYRRQARARVAEVGGRGAAHGRNQRARDKAELFEGALARVSTALAKAARASAAELRAERLVAAREARAAAAPRSAPRSAAQPRPAAVKPSPKPRPTKTTGRQLHDASVASAGRRRQARRDSR
ncbi:MAG TPA: hypothetical protein VFV89_03580 [Nocardioides sp.]|uniref:hypothetical protein n=1 Tax=Nocardioides sp. TaxID=35761 RepID=UPI002E3246A3|nr:hypothetical protein [Nocardioides sp.]HEX5086863.1 hypothetical protein [Nocardioides sp.]